MIRGFAWMFLVAATLSLLPSSGHAKFVCTSFHNDTQVCLTVAKSTEPFNCSNGDSVAACSGVRGVCNHRTGQCICSDNFITWPRDQVTRGPQCNRRQTVRLGAFHLHVVLGYATGVGAFMLGETAYGVCALLLFIFGLAFKIYGESHKDPKCSVLGRLCTIGGFGLWIAILVQIGTGSFTDKNGVPLGRWV